MWRRPAVLAVFLFQIALLAIGAHRDYRLKHEDNNALHATFARSHLHLGWQVTRAQNYFYNTAGGSGTFYAHHPPGPGLVLAVAYGLSGAEGPLITRATASLFHVLALALFFSMARRVFEREWEAVLAAFIFALLPQSAFFGRMMNHEVLVLPAGILLVDCYWRSVRGAPAAKRWMVIAGIASVWAALSGWAGFFVIGACALHAGWSTFIEHDPRARVPLAVLSVGALLLFALNLAHLAWVQGGDLGYLRELMASRMGAGTDRSAIRWLGNILDIHRRYFTMTGLVALGAVAFFGIRGLRRGAPRHAAIEVGSIFLLAGAGYVGVFNFSSAKHHYWQFLLLPASAIAITLAFRWLLSRSFGGRRRALWLSLSILAGVEVVASSVDTLVKRHTKPEPYCIETVERFRRELL